MEIKFWTPIYVAVKEGKLDVVRELLSWVKMDIENEFVWTVIYIAAINGHVWVVRELLNRGVRMDVAHLSMQQPEQATWRLFESC